MHKQEQIKNKILNLAKTDDRIRAVLLNGSRANSKVNPDKYQDYDLVFIVNNFDTFLKDRSWINILGNPILKQLPDEMELGKEENENKVSFIFLMIFEGGTRIDLTLFPNAKFETHFKIDSLTIAWLDKDNLFKNISKSSDKDYLITKPNQQEFSEVCNEFWWTILNVAKGLKRGEIIYAKEILENNVRPMLWQLIEWNIGSKHNFKISVGKSGKFANKFMAKSLYENILKTYTNSNIENNWDALFLMTKIFHKEQKRLAKNLNFHINTNEAKNSKEYLKQIRKE